MNVQQAWKNASKKLKITIPISVFLLLLLSYGLIHQRSKNPPAEPPKLVEIETLAPASIEKTIKLIGTIRPKHATVLVAKGAGLLDTLRSSGETVKKGDLIAKIINPDLEKNYTLSKDTQQIAKIQYERLHGLQKSGIVSTREVEEKKQAWINAQKERAKAKIELKNTRFYAPFNGVIGAFKTKEGTQIIEGTAVVTIYDPQSLNVELDIPCTNTTPVTKNQTVYIFKQRYHLSHMQKMLDDESHMCPADVDIQCTHCLIGSTVTARLVLKKKEHVLVLPTQAFFLKNGNTHVYKIVDKKIELVPVTTGILEHDKMEVISGLKAGEQIVIKNPERLYPSMEVSVYQATPKNIKG